MTSIQWVMNDPPRRTAHISRDGDGYICQLHKRWVAPGGLNPRSCTWTGRGATEADAEAAACAKAEHRLRNSRMDAPPLATCLGLRHQGRRS